MKYVKWSVLCGVLACLPWIVALTLDSGSGGGTSLWTLSGNDVYRVLGNVGIGETTPSAKLEVAGQIKMTGGNPNIGRLLTTDASGLASWIDVGIDVILAEGQGFTTSRGIALFGNVLSIFGGDVAFSTDVLVVDDSTSRVGIGTATPNATMEIRGTPGTVVGGFPSGQFHVTSTSALINANSVITGHNLNSGNKQLWYFGSTSSSSDDIALINRQNGAMFFSTNNTTRMFIDSLGMVGFGITGPAFPLHMASGAHVTSGGVWTNASSRDLKENVEKITLQEALTALNGLEPVSFNYKIDRDEHHVGFIAEDLPDLVATKNHKGLSPTDIIAVLTKVVQEQQRQIDEIRKAIK